MQQTPKTYYNETHLIDQRHQDTGCSMRDIRNILNSLHDVVRDRLGDVDNHVEIKLFPGLKIISRYIPVKQSSLNLCKNGIIQSDYLLYLDGKFSNRFKNEIKKLHDNPHQQ